MHRKGAYLEDVLQFSNSGSVTSQSGEFSAGQHKTADGHGQVEQHASAAIIIFHQLRLGAVGIFGVVQFEERTTHYQVAHHRSYK